MNSTRLPCFNICPPGGYDTCVCVPPPLLWGFFSLFWRAAKNKSWAITTQQRDSTIEQSNFVIFYIKYIAYDSLLKLALLPVVFVKKCSVSSRVFFLLLFPLNSIVFFIPCVSCFIIRVGRRLSKKGFLWGGVFFFYFNQSTHLQFLINLFKFKFHTFSKKWRDTLISIYPPHQLIDRLMFKWRFKIPPLTGRFFRLVCVFCCLCFFFWRQFRNTFYQLLEE